ncbi:hypothetical protein [Maribacter sp. 2210JD10-5]|uniref:hypothetical protein n=1 Tax=Maribacter sp. 2210JD10-5 TaxID=3386272 RepID=UPI0039BD0AD7
MRTLIKAGSKMLRCLSLIFVIAILSTACKGQKNISASNIDDDNVKMELIVQDNYSGAETEEHLLIKDQKALMKFYGQINRTRKPGLPLPAVDFEKEMLFVWCSGEKSSANPKVPFITKETDSSFVIQKRKLQKSDTTNALVSPFYIYKMPLSKKLVVIE